MQEISIRISEEYKCRSLVAGPENELIIGTQSLNHSNKLHILKYDDDNLSLDIVHTHDFPEEVWFLSVQSPNSSQVSRDLAVGGKSSITIGNYSESWTSKCAFTVSSRLTSLAWDDKLYYTSTDEVFKADLVSQTSESLLASGSAGGYSVIKVDPNHKFLLAIAQGNDLFIHDTRDHTARYSIAPVHGDKVLDLDFNPNYPYHLVTCSKDSCIKFWDIRKQSCLKTIKEHSHFVYSVKFNTFHDQLIISASSDNSVALHRVVSTSSAPADESFFEKESDCLVSRVDNFEDSVYACTWLSGEPWHFASVSYDGKVVVAAVPSEEKYKILL